MITVWYLIIAFGTDGGVATIPQVSEQACKQTAAWIVAHRWDTDTPRFGYCVPGVKQ